MTERFVFLRFDIHPTWYGPGSETYTYYMKNKINKIWAAVFPARNKRVKWIATRFCCRATLSPWIASQNVRILLFWPYKQLRETSGT